MSFYFILTCLFSGFLLLKEDGVASYSFYHSWTPPCLKICIHGQADRFLRIKKIINFNWLFFLKERFHAAWNTYPSWQALNWKGKGKACLCSMSNSYNIFVESMYRAVVRTLASHQCDPGLIPGPAVMCGLSVLFPAQRLFLWVLRFISLQNWQPVLPNSDSIGSPKTTGLSVHGDR